MKLVSFHLFNDYSGSPKVLKMVLDGLLERNFEVDLVTSQGGVLDELSSDHLRAFHYSYKFSKNPIVTMLRYCWTQIYTLFFSLRYLFQKDVVFYINTILPAGPAFVGRLMGKRVIYHYHEDAQTKGAFYRFLAALMSVLATDIICVSDYQRSFVKREKRVWVVPNALPDEFIQSLTVDHDQSFAVQTILFVASLKRYKGVGEFVKLAGMLPQYQFVAVLNEEQERIAEFAKAEKWVIPDNLTFYPRQEAVAPFYQKASLLLNLSDPSQFVETFGLTVLEAMSAGLPVIVPTKGGVAELVREGLTGYHINSSQLAEIRERITQVLSDKALYDCLSDAAWRQSKEYSRDQIIGKITAIIQGEIRAEDN